MDATIHALSELLLKRFLPSFSFLFLTAYLQRVYFKPLGKILEERRQATEGLREISEKAFAAADEKNSAYEQAVRSARAEIGAQNDKLRRQWLDEQADKFAKARADAEAKLTAERNTIAAEMSQASAEMEAQIQPLKDQMIAALLRRSAA